MMEVQETWSATASPASLEALAKVGESIRFRKGELFGRQGEPASYLYAIVTGHVILHRRGRDGEDYALYLLGPGELFGEGSVHSARKWLATVRSVTPGTGLRIPSDALQGLARQSPAALEALLTLMSERLERSHRRVDVLTTSGARERVLGLLRLMVETTGRLGGGSLWVPMRVTQGELAEMLGLARETVSRVLSELEQAGIVRKSTRAGIWVNPGFLD